MGDEEIRERLTQALFRIDTGHPSGLAGMSYDEAAAQLLPFVVGNMRRYAALHLRDAADEIRARFGWAGGYGKSLRARADELDPMTPTVRRRPDDEARTAQAKENR